MTQQSHCWAYTPRKSMSKFYWLLLQDLQNLATYHCSTWSKPSSFLLWIIGMVFRLPPLPPTACFQYGSIVDQPKPAHTPLQCPPLSKVLAVIFQGPQSLAHYPSGLIALLSAISQRARHSPAQGPCTCSPFASALAQNAILPDTAMTCSLIFFRSSLKHYLPGGSSLTT